MMRLVSQQLDAALEANRQAPVNFGLSFNKFLQFTSSPVIEPVVKQNWLPLIGKYNLARTTAAAILKDRHIKQSNYCRKMAECGYKIFTVHARLTSPFISGLGMSHPTETGMVLDHTSGMPYIPAASLKGVQRLAYLINSLQDENGDWLEENNLLEAGIIKMEKCDTTGEVELCWQEDATSKTIFGFSEKKDSLMSHNNQTLASQLISLDAYPLTPPDLGEEILNPHFGDYYKSKRGPTEDQNTNPIKFLVVKTGAEFVFRFLLRQPFANAPIQDQDKLTDLVAKNITRALTEEGIGAKTALGLGRFAVVANQEPALLTTWKHEREDEKEPWRAVIRKIKGLDVDWGQLKQVLDNEQVKEFKKQKDVTSTVKELAQKIKKARPKKWTDERDKYVADWLAPSGVGWESADKPKEKETTPPQTSDKNTDLLRSIERITTFADFKELNIRINKLDKNSAQALKKKFQKLGYKKADKKTPERKAWDQLLKRLKKI